MIKYMNFVRKHSVSFKEFCSFISALGSVSSSCSLVPLCGKEIKKKKKSHRIIFRMIPLTSGWFLVNQKGKKTINFHDMNGICIVVCAQELTCSHCSLLWENFVVSYAIENMDSQFIWSPMHLHEDCCSPVARFGQQNNRCGLSLWCSAVLRHCTKMQPR